MELDHIRNDWIKESAQPNGIGGVFFGLFPPKISPRIQLPQEAEWLQIRYSGAKAVR
jgi:hypothetical protein